MNNRHVTVRNKEQGVGGGAFSRRESLAVALAMVFTTLARADYRIIVLGQVVSQVLQYRVWQVNSRGQIAPFPYEFPSGYDATLLGSTVPLPSPDGRWIAFGRDYDIHLLDVSSRRERQITTLGQPPRKGYTFADVLLDAWSPDSRQFLFAVNAGETTSEWGELSVPDAPYGFYIYDLATETSRMIALPKTFQFAAWLQDGRFLGTMSRPGPPCEVDRLVQVRPGDTQGVAMRAPAGSVSRAQVSADGKCLTAVFVRGCKDPHRAEIARIDLATMSVTQVVPLHSWTGNEFPAPSPNAQHISYKRMIRMVKGIPQESLIVDQRPLYSCPGVIDYKWLDEQSIAVACQDSVLVLDVKTGHTLGRYTTPSTKLSDGLVDDSVPDDL